MINKFVETVCKITPCYECHSYARCRDEKLACPVFAKFVENGVIRKTAWALKTPNKKIYLSLYPS